MSRRSHNPLTDVATAPPSVFVSVRMLELAQRYRRRSRLRMPTRASAVSEIVAAARIARSPASRPFAIGS